MRDNVRVLTSELPKLQLVRRQQFQSYDQMVAERERQGKAEFDHAASMLGRLLIILCLGSFCFGLYAKQQGWF